VSFAILVWPATGWVPGLPSRGSGTRETVRFGIRLMATSLLNHFASNVDRIVVGRFGGDHVTGLYDRAVQLLGLPLSQINVSVAAVAIPGLSRLHEDPKRFEAGYLQAVRLVTTVSAPLIVLMFLWADDLVRILLGVQWLEVVDLFRILAVAGLTQAVAMTTRWLYIATGRSAAMLRWRLQTIWVLPLFVPLGMYLWGAEGVAAAGAVISTVMTPLGIWVAQRGTKLDTWATIKMAGLPILAALVSGAALWPFADRIPLWAAILLMPALHMLVACAFDRSLAPIREIWALRTAFLKRQPV
jgi:PST family polysaccharide transporter